MASKIYRDVSPLESGVKEYTLSNFLMQVYSFITVYQLDISSLK